MAALEYYRSKTLKTVIFGQKWPNFVGFAVFISLIAMNELLSELSLHYRNFLLSSWRASYHLLARVFFFIAQPNNRTNWNCQSKRSWTMDRPWLIQKSYKLLREFARIWRECEDHLQFNTIFGIASVFKKLRELWPFHIKGRAPRIMGLFWNWIERGLTTEGQIYKLQTRICEPNQDAHTTEDGSTSLRKR